MEQDEMINAILRAVSEVTGITIAALGGKSRQRDIADARFIAAWELKEAGLTAVKIGEILNRQHTTILHGFRQYADNRDYNRAFEQLAQQVARKVKEAIPHKKITHNTNKHETKHPISPAPTQSRRSDRPDRKGGRRYQVQSRNRKRD